ncbi:MAG: restriction endonuclease subunit S [Pseudobutyrivibrio ruminis]|jgi:type I restriction enzyme S subunit|uniref:restriction endonuclease subunit S n=1 Tax=Clostridium TaxID=1485 RepID=UPI0018AA3B7C|nr:MULTISPECIES: restriction endonuclease subunit S [Clostridium]MBE5917868.1 restriction endonuclease subunit S [Pseudobutyrivibrio ruminis]MBE6064194.1 restriction endonuclease subunit S [Clostridium cochlearium]
MSKQLFVDTPIKKMGDVITGKTPRTAIQDNYGTDYMFITPSELHNRYIINYTERGLSEKGFASIKNNTISGISVLVGCIGWDMGNVALCIDTCATNQQINSITNFKDGYNPYYVYYWLSTKKDYLFQIASVTRTPILNKSTFEEILIPMPEINVQNNIVSVLSAIDKKIVHNNCLITELEEMAKAIFDYWFVQFDFPNAEGKPYRSNGGEMVWNEKLNRKMPNGWEVCLVSDLLDKAPNTTRIQSSEYLLEGSIPVIDQSTDFIAGYTDEESALISTTDGAIVFGDHTRIVKFIGFDFARGADGTQILISNNKKNMPQLLFYYSIQKIDLSNYGYARHFKFLKDSLIVVPNEEVAQRFKEIVEPLHKVISHKIVQNLKLAKLRDWLLPMLMNGQVAVK